MFLDWTRPGVPRARIFTPAAEIPFAGHPLVGAGWVLGAMGPGTARRVACGIGEIPFRFEGDRVFIEVPLPREVEPADAAPGPGRPPEAERAWLVRLPLRYLLLEVGAPEAVAGAAPDLGRAGRGSRGRARCSSPRSGAAVKARFFAPALGVAERTRRRGAPRWPWRRHWRSPGRRRASLTMDQGDEVGAPSRLEVVWGGGIVAVGGAVRRDEVRVLER